MFDIQKKIFTKHFCICKLHHGYLFVLSRFLFVCCCFLEKHMYRIHSLLRLLLLQWLFLPVWNKSAQQSSPAYAWIFVWYLPTCLESKLSEECKRNTICTKAEKDSRYFHFSPGSRLSTAVLLKMQHVSSCDFSFMAEQVFGVITSGWR